MAKDVEIDVDGKKAETDKAICFVIEGKDVWIPKSQIKDQCGEDDEIESIFISEFLANEKGLI